MPIVIRDARATDIAGLAQLITTLGYPSDANELTVRLQKMPAESYRTIVAEEADRIIGFIGLLTLNVYEHNAPIGWILALSVREDFRRRGVGKALLAAAEKHYHQQGVADIRLHSGFQRDGAHEFYETIGFDKSGYRFKKRLS